MGEEEVPAPPLVQLQQGRKVRALQPDDGLARRLDRGEGRKERRHDERAEGAYGEPIGHPVQVEGVLRVPRDGHQVFEGVGERALLQNDAEEEHDYAGRGVAAAVSDGSRGVAVM